MLKRPLLFLLGQRDGTALIEFSLAFPILLIAVLGVIEFGRLMWTQNALHYSVEQAARCMTLDPTNCGTVALARSYAATTSGLTFTNASIFSPTFGTTCGTGVTGNLMQVTYTFQFLTSFFNISQLVPQSLTLTAQGCFPA